jgi:uncharacterized protein (DUF1684 family)
MLMALTFALAAAAPAAADPYLGQIEKWRATREERLRADGGWLTVSGLFWLKDGPNTFGSGKGNDIVLPASAPARAGVFEFTPGAAPKTTVRVELGAQVLAGGKPLAAPMDLRADTAEGGPDVLVMGPVSLQVIERGGRYGVRMKDNQSEKRRAFAGLQWFPVREPYRVTARFVPHPAPTTIDVANVLGQVDALPSPGYAVFTVGGKEVRLHPVLEEPGATQLFFIFRDGTSGKETYPAGRFLYTEMPKDGTVTLDFNKAYSPPCAFTPFATCPIPPRQNWLGVRIEAGEKRTPGMH